MENWHITKQASNIAQEYMQFKPPTYYPIVYDNIIQNVCNKH